MRTLENKIKKLMNKNPVSISGMQSSLGHKWKECDLDNIEECIMWLRMSDKNSIRFLFDNGTFEGEQIFLKKNGEL
jgi:hypothetical protein